MSDWSATRSRALRSGGSYSPTPGLRGAPPVSAPSSFRLHGTIRPAPTGSTFSWRIGSRLRLSPSTSQQSRDYWQPGYATSSRLTDGWTAGRIVRHPAGHSVPIWALGADRTVAATMRHRPTDQLLTFAHDLYAERSPITSGNGIPKRRSPHRPERRVCRTLLASRLDRCLLPRAPPGTTRLELMDPGLAGILSWPFGFESRARPWCYRLISGPCRFGASIPGVHSGCVNGPCLWMAARCSAAWRRACL